MCYFLKGEKQDYYVNKVMEEMKKVVPIVYRCCEDSEDGEAVAGCDKNGEVKLWITFDPNERLEMDKHIEKGTLLEYIIG
ncbi:MULTISPECIES: hypothetical protein [unclassified Clostridioides]|uniref:hypothetical protein n=1 Tax=unclassified Clostridioides TaxID=2635829 RepID=UPI001D119AB4|nr:hypothetical protein [Clostridioides sp. ZZV14-6150]MCC0661938.1 hypothetical protein [Clostridioides sp. ZZV14-6154]MCC0670019.1 hypothetical protein [Clostridioides sp. ZZV14-6153]MCC0719200.1 hypothetical protein [Clostridioides sp. ZZV14-6105]MCC0724037.1 hypothetical protein [Clostridioides sp. ZZV14-6104]MCC0726124.1 hypothetical protein [Clostridioides sp. ZZV14-6045]MCC0730845.1 hypothetical protein [Clostridioides sp. ZZV14-6048]MCC0735805.1 hypothetical protein [Clostridioides s